MSTLPCNLRPWPRVLAGVARRRLFGRGGDFTRSGGRCDRGQVLLPHLRQSHADVAARDVGRPTSSCLQAFCAPAVAAVAAAAASCATAYRCVRTRVHARDSACVYATVRGVATALPLRLTRCSELHFSPGFMRDGLWEGAAAAGNAPEHAADEQAKARAWRHRQRRTGAYARACMPVTVHVCWPLCAAWPRRSLSV
jgi:hypothetical protein